MIASVLDHRRAEDGRSRGDRDACGVRVCGYGDRAAADVDLAACGSRRGPRSFCCGRASILDNLWRLEAHLGERADAARNRVTTEPTRQLV
jgi:hypothetical protein